MTAPAKEAIDDKVSILLVDDRADKLMALEAVLGDLGQKLVKATSGKEALKAVLKQDFAVILLDVNMPGMDGFETAALIRQRKKSEKTPIIFFTALSDTDTHVTRGYSLGAVDYLRIPVEPDILRAKVAAFVDLYKKTEKVKQQAEMMRELQEREHRTQLAAATDQLEAETKRNRFFTLAIDMLAIAGFDGHFKQLNPSWEKTLGFTDEELKAKPLIEFVHLEDRASTEEQLHKLQTGASITYFENRYRTKAGGWRWLGWTAAPFAEEGLIYIFARDLTERKVAEEERLHLIREQTARAAAEASERRAAFLADAGISLTSSLDYHTTLARLVRLAVPFMADWCALDVRDEDGTVRRVEVAHADAAKEDLGRQLMAFSPDPEGEDPQARVMRTREPFLAPECNDEMLAGLVRDGEARSALRAGGSSMMVIPLVARGRPLGALTFLSPHSSRTYGRLDLELAEELGRRAALAADNAWLYRSSQEARKGAERANRAKDEFLATLSHELRTPLTPILGWTVMLRSGTLDQAGMLRGLEVIERNVRAQTQLIEDLLDVSRIVTGKLRVEVRPIDLVPVVEAGLDAVRPSAEAKEIQLDVKLEPIDSKVLADPDRLQQVVWNLASNAVKFTPKGGRMEVRLSRADSHVHLSVKDNGKGISADFLPYVFDRFRQADSTSTRKYGGLGLGLAIVRHLVELHGGTVHAESEGPDRGATFTVRLPLMEERSVAAGPAGRGSETTDPAAMRLDGVKVMVVDDELDMRDFLSVSLRQYGADVTALASVGEAVEALEREKPDVLVSDIGMPGEDGYALIRKVRALGPERGGQVPAAALTGFAAGDDTTRVLSAGYQVHLPKPVEPSQLAQVVGTLAGRSGLN
ncbi:MAG TPA: response regulator [Vicinamibacteria bacterium]|nr:response regulator [Vicinamibacteria bacterium]